MSVLVEQGRVLHILVVERASSLQIFADCDDSRHGKSENVFHFSNLTNLIIYYKSVYPDLFINLN